VALLDTYSGTTNTTRVVSLSDAYDSFQITATWTGGNNVAISVSASSSRPGPSFQTQSSPLLPIFGNGSPLNVVVAPVEIRN
jgi:hypothetical protein